MPQNPRAAEKQARIIRARLERLARPGGPLANADIDPYSLAIEDIVQSVDPNEPWPVNLDAVLDDLLPPLESGDARRLR